MDESQIMQTLCRWLDGHLSQTGFSRYGNSEFFRKTITGGIQAVGIGAWDNRPVFEIGIVICLRLHAVEQVYHDFIGSTTSQFRENSFTVITPFNFFAGGPSRVQISDANALAGLLTSWDAPMKDEVKPYLEIATTLEAVDDLINVQRDVINTISPENACMGQIILAKLARNPNYDDLVIHYHDYLHDINYSTERYNQCIEYLKSI